MRRGRVAPQSQARRPQTRRFSGEKKASIQGLASLVLHKTEVLKKRRVRDQERQRAEGARPELREGRRPQLDFLSMPLPH